jgi:membrane associated rhomboid family serine protease
MATSLYDKYEHLKFRYAVFMVISFVMILWLVKALEIASGSDYAQFGILPRTLRGTIGIITGPMIHGDLIHLLSNTLPFLVLGTLLFYFYHKIAIEIFIWIYIATGFWIWLLARNAYHIGASGLVYGMASFLFFGGIFRRDNQLMTISGIIILLYGGMLYGIFPDFVEHNVSWEAHLTGSVVGLILAFWFRKTGINTRGKTRLDNNEDEEQNDGTYFKPPSISDDIEVTYTYKPSNKNE